MHRDHIEGRRHRHRSIRDPPNTESPTRRRDGQLLEHPCEHERSVAHYVARDDQEYDLPRECHADKAVKVFGPFNQCGQTQLHKVLRR